MNTIVITGATSGIGLEVVRLLANEGCQIIGIGHSQENCEKADKNIKSTNPQAKLKWFTAELLQQREVLKVAGEIRNWLDENSNGELYSLINNAGCARSWYMTTEDGYEHQFALNYLAGFLLTHELIPYLLKSKGRVIMTSSQSHKGIKVHWNDVMLTNGYNPLIAYKQSKLCDVLLAKGLNDIYGESGIHAYAVDPGLVKTDIGNKTAGIVDFVWKFRKLGGVDPKVPAQTYHYLCTQEDAPESLYYYLSKEQKFSKEVTSENAARLFELSKKLCGITYEREVR